MDAEHRRSVELELEPRLEPSEKVLVRLAELRPAPFALVAQHRPRLQRQRGNSVQHPGVPVAEDNRARDLAQPLDRLARLRPGCHVSEADEPVDTGLVQLAENSIEREQVAVDVRDQAEAHRAEA